MSGPVKTLETSSSAEGAPPAARNYSIHLRSREFSALEIDFVIDHWHSSLLWLQGGQNLGCKANRGKEVMEYIPLSRFKKGNVYG
jgi:hypothetical protein